MPRRKRKQNRADRNRTLEPLRRQYTEEADSYEDDEPDLPPDLDALRDWP